LLLKQTASSSKESRSNRFKKYNIVLLCGETYPFDVLYDNNI